MIKHQADSYANLEKFDEAAKLMEDLAKKVEDDALKGYFYYTVGNFFENSNNLKKAEESYDLSISFIENKEGLEDFLSLAYYQSARLKIENNKISDAATLLEKVLEQTSEDVNPDLEVIRKMSIYLLVTLKNKV